MNASRILRDPWTEKKTQRFCEPLWTGLRPVSGIPVVISVTRHWPRSNAHKYCVSNKTCRVWRVISTRNRRTKQRPGTTFRICPGPSRMPSRRNDFCHNYYYFIRSSAIYYYCRYSANACRPALFTSRLKAGRRPLGAVRDTRPIRSVAVWCDRPRDSYTMSKVPDRFSLDQNIAKFRRSRARGETEVLTFKNCLNNERVLEYLARTYFRDYPIFGTYGLKIKKLHNFSKQRSI